MAQNATVLWDLDGTLTNSFLGISRSMQHVTRTLGVRVPDAEELRAEIGPPIQHTLAKLLGTNDTARIDEAIQLYRQRYDEIGKLENEVIAGIPEALVETAAVSDRMFVATSKFEKYSIDIVRHFGMSQFFQTVHGSQGDGSRADKGQLIAYILETEGLTPERTVMIGDRMHDIVGAKKNNLPVIGVLWGFGDRAELEGAGATAIAEHPSEIAGLVQRLAG